MFIVESLSGQQILAFEETRVLTVEDAGASLLAKPIADVVAQDSHERQPNQQGPEIQKGWLRRRIGFPGAQPSGPQDAVGGQKEAKEQAGLGEDDAKRSPITTSNDDLFSTHTLSSLAVAALRADRLIQTRASHAQTGQRPCQHFAHYHSGT